MIGGIIAGAGALIGGSMIANANRDVAAAQLQGLDRCQKDFRNASYAQAEALRGIGKSIDGLNETFDNEFNDRNKRLVQINFTNEDDEPVKLSEYFNQVPVFKEHLRSAFFSDTKKGHSRFSTDSHNQDLYNDIQNMPNIKEALELVKFLTQWGLIEQVIPYQVYEDFFMDTTSYYGVDDYRTLHKGFTIIYYRFTADFVDKIKDYYRDEIKKLEGQIALVKGIKNGNPFPYELKRDKYKAIIEKWNPVDEEAQEYFKKIDDLVDQTRDFAQEMLMCGQERYLRRAVRNFAKPGVSFELSSLDYSGENVIFTLKKEDGEAYLIIRLAPNVHITDKEGF